MSERILTDAEWKAEIWERYRDARANERHYRDALEHIAGYRYSAEMCRYLATQALNDARRTDE